MLPVKRTCTECHKPFEACENQDTCISCMLKPSHKPLEKEFDMDSVPEITKKPRGRPRKTAANDMTSPVPPVICSHTPPCPSTEPAKASTRPGPVQGPVQAPTAAESLPVTLIYGGFRITIERI